MDAPPIQTNGGTDNLTAQAWNEPTGDVEMKDSTAPHTPSNGPVTSVPEVASQSHSQTQSRAHTPTRPTQVAPANATASAAPSTANPHGAPVRIYLNQKVTPHLLEGLKHLAVYEPEKPLKWLADYLQKKSEELEG